MLACTASTAPSTALDGRWLDTPSTTFIPPPPPNAVSLSGPILDPAPQSFPHRLQVVEGPLWQPLQIGQEVVGRPRTAGAGDQRGAVGREDRGLEMTGQLASRL